MEYLEARAVHGPKLKFFPKFSGWRWLRSCSTGFGQGRASQPDRPALRSEGAPHRLSLLSIATCVSGTLPGPGERPQILESVPRPPATIQMRDRSPPWLAARSPALARPADFAL